MLNSSQFLLLQFSLSFYFPHRLPGAAELLFLLLTASNQSVFPFPKRQVFTQITDMKRGVLGNQKHAVIGLKQRKLHRSNTGLWRSSRKRSLLSMERCEDTPWKLKSWEMVGWKISRDMEPRTGRQELEENFKIDQLVILEEVGFKEKTSMAISDSHILKSHRADFLQALFYIAVKNPSTIRNN